MSENDLIPETLKQQHIASIAESNTFETHGVSKKSGE